MRRLARPVPSFSRIPLDSGWAIAHVASGHEPPDDMRWCDIGAPAPVAAALAAVGEWSLDGPARDFDQGQWWYRCRFDRPAGEGPWVLGLDGLAGLAEAWLNGQAVLASRNMFRAHELAVPANALQANGNELLIRFDSLNDALAQRRPRPRWRVPMLAHQQLRWWRTTLLGRTPGWSPPAAPVGPWRPVWLEPTGGLRITALRLHAGLIGQAGRLQVDLGLDVGSLPVRSLRVRIERADAPGGTSYQAALAPAGGPGEWSAQLDLPQVARWWPHTHGEPALYQVSLLVDDGSPRPPRLALGRVGFRHIRVDRTGNGFQFIVNDVPVFARGACWTPLDTLRLHAEPARYGSTLARLRAAGLNMLRVGGTMVYEDDAFLDACDTHGVLLWQDLMFASMDYPGDDAAFLADVDEEVTQQLSRLQARPCVAIVCGNSEVEQQAAMWGAPRELWSPPLFHDHLPALVEARLPGVPYWPSSAHGGAFPFQPAAGTTSYYGVGAYGREPSDARHSGLRFATESLGFANVPTDTTLARLRDLNDGQVLRVHSPLWKARASRDLGAGWDFDDVRDHYVERLFGERADALRHHDPARHLMLGRAATAEAITTAFHHWRATGSACGGALVWFLRDLWAGAGWGLMDDLGLPKSGFHALARACQPLHLGLTDDGLNGLTLHLANEHAEALDLRLELCLYRNGEIPVAQATVPVSLAARGAQALPVVGLLDGFMDWNWAYRFGPPTADVLVVRGLSADARLQAELVHFITAGAQTPLRCADLGLEALSRALPDGSRRLTLRSRAAARAVHLEAEGWQASDEFFNLPPGGERVLDCVPVPGHARPWRAMVQAINSSAPVVVKEGG